MFREIDLFSAVQTALRARYPGWEVTPDPIFGGARPDFIVQPPRGGTPIIAEVKTITPSTSLRLELTIAQLQQYATAFETKHPAGEKPHLLLILLGVISDERAEYATHKGVEILSGPTLRDLAPDEPWPQEWAKGRTRSPTQHPLVSALEAIPPGREDWALYQQTVGEILAETLSPPLSTPINEHSNESRVNRRDIIIPNYAEAGFWAFMLAHYNAHYIVVDAKNYKGAVKKKDVLQVGNYLSAHGAGLFGMIVTRTAADRSANVTRREQWSIYRKLIIVLNDGDLKEMISRRETGQDPSEVIRQKIEDFRLEF
jgi:hypothetical protein